MKGRCYNRNRKKDYEEYGARGIIICDEWLNKENGFINFYNWSINNGYDDNLSIDRINVNGNYEPLNCRWATDKIQANNKTTTIYIEYNGENKPLSYWSEKYNIPYDALNNRIINLKMTIDEAIQGYKPMNEIEKIYTYNNETHNLHEWSTILNIDYGTLKSRARKTNNVNDIFKKPKNSIAKTYIYNGNSHTLKEWSIILNIPNSKLKYRINKQHMTIEEALKVITV